MKFSSFDLVFAVSFDELSYRNNTCYQECEQELGHRAYSYPTLSEQMYNIAARRQSNQKVHKANSSMMPTIGIPMALRSSSVMCNRAVIST